MSDDAAQNPGVDASGAVQPVDPFDQPFEPLVSEATTVDDSYDLNDESHVAALQVQSSFPSEMIDPAQVYGADKWDSMSFVSPADARSRFSLDWDWNMTPGQKINALADVASAKRWNAIIDEFSETLTRVPADPQTIAQDVLARRMEREGR